MQVGMFRLSTFLTATKVSASHYVDPDQYEPTDRVPLDEQAEQHAQTFLLVNADVTLSYTLTDRFQMMLKVPLKLADIRAAFLDKDGHEIPGFVSIHHRTETLVGLGDIELNGRYRLLVAGHGQPYEVGLGLGFSLPTGHIEPNPFALGRMGRINR